MTKSIIAASLAGAGLLSLSLPASADVYGGSSLGIENLLIRFQDAGGADASSNVAIRSFNFSSTNTAILNGVGTVTNANCSNTVACGAGPVLDPTAANAPGSAFNRTNNQVSGADNSLHWFTIGGGNWSNSDSVIYTSEITTFGASPTKTDQIAEANINSVSSASANSEITSNTGLTFSFTVAGPNPVNFVMSWLADPDMRAQILNDLGIAQSTMAVSVNLSKDGTNNFVRWDPQGTFGAPTDNDCAFFGAGLTCSETADSEDLNLSVSTSTNNTASDHSYGPNASGMLAYGINAGGLTAGDWTLSLRAFVSTNLTREVQIPEPGILALFGIGLAGVGFAQRRRAKK